MKRKKVPKQTEKVQKLDPISSLNEYYMCVCGSKYKHKLNLVRHVERCTCNNYNSLLCQWCNVQFKNRGNLINHSYYMHGALKKAVIKSKIRCEACDALFAQNWQLRYHIRRFHFNLLATIPHAHAKEVNQVWFEKVLNTNLVMQIKKTGANSLIMKPIPPNAGVTIHSDNKLIDLSEHYPTGRKKIDEICGICFKIYRKKDIKKHMDEKHFKIMKHRCNNCCMSFKRSYQFLQHVCHKTRHRIKGVQQCKTSSIKIASVESRPVLIN